MLECNLQCTQSGIELLHYVFSKLQTNNHLDVSKCFLIASVLEHPEQMDDLAPSQRLKHHVPGIKSFSMAHVDTYLNFTYIFQSDESIVQHFPSSFLALLL